MKKLFSFVFVLLLCVASFAFTACNQPEAISETPPEASTDSPDADDSTASTDSPDTDDTTPEEPAEPVLTPTDIGYQVPIYPACAFYYKVDDDCTFYITEMSLTLTKINEINENDIVTDYCFLYEYTLSVVANTDPSNSGNKYDIHFHSHTDSVSASSIVKDDGSILWERESRAWTLITETYYYFINKSTF